MENKPKVGDVAYYVGLDSRGNPRPMVPYTVTKVGRTLATAADETGHERQFYFELNNGSHKIKVNGETFGYGPGFFLCEDEVKPYLDRKRKSALFLKMRRAFDLGGKPSDFSMDAIEKACEALGIDISDVPKAG